MWMWLFIITPVIVNLWFRKLLNSFQIIGGVCHVVFFLASIISLVVLADHSTTDYVFRTVTHDITGWTNPGVAFGLGLLTMTFPVGGADGLLHMSDEIKSVRTSVAHSIIIATACNAIMDWCFAVTLLFTIGNVNQVINTSTSLPIIEVYYQATGSKAAATVFVFMNFIVLFFALLDTMASVSRLTWAFARDHGLPFHSFFSAIHPRYKMPLNALGLISVVCFLLSLIYIGSTTAYNAIISLSGIAASISYVIPILFIALRKVSGPPIKYGPFQLGRWGIPINTTALAYLCYIVTWMPFPQFLPVTRETFNYAGPVFGTLVLMALGDWFISGRKRFQIPVARNIPEF